MVAEICQNPNSRSPTGPLDDGETEVEVEEGCIGRNVSAVANHLRGRAQEVRPLSSRGTTTSEQLGEKRVVPEYLWDRHWTENPSALEMMKPMKLVMKAPPLQQRLTQFHATRVPIHMVFFIQTTELEQLGVADKFWCRIAKHKMVWRGLYCRDYDLSAGGARGRCVWRTLHGRAAENLCLFHMRFTHPPEFAEVCKQITAIPGRSKAELLQSYIEWRDRRKRRHESLQLHAIAGGTSGLPDDLAATGSSTSSLPALQPQVLGPAGLGARTAAADGSKEDALREIGPLRMQCCSGLSARHARPLPNERLLSPVGRTPRKPRKLKVSKPPEVLPLEPVRPPYSARARTAPAVPRVSPERRPIPGTR